MKMKTKIYIFLLISLVLATLLMFSSCVKKENFVDETGKFSTISAKTRKAYFQLSGKYLYCICIQCIR